MREILNQVLVIKESLGVKEAFILLGIVDGAGLLVTLITAAIWSWR